ncbi:dATP/dGTP pyrophosphohydrolase domain-containing protein [Achromobacter xylosoxidans]
MTNQNNAAQAADKLPHWEEISAKLSRSETLTPLELFIHENEPGGDAAASWRDQLDAALASAPVAGQPFMYGIMGPDGKAHFEEFCVSGDRDELQAEVVDHLNRDNPEDGPYSVVALFRDAAPKASESDFAKLQSAYVGACDQIAELSAEKQASAEAFDFVAYLARQAEFSARTFGPGARVAGVCDHIRKELIEVETSGGDLKEWVDVIILGLDGAWRSGATPQEIIAAIVAKQAKNEARTWPDWRTVDPSKAIEHDRGGQP